VVAVAESRVEVLPVEPVDEFGRLVARCLVLEAENEQLWTEAARLVGETDRLRARVGKAGGPVGGGAPGGEAPSGAVLARNRSRGRVGLGVGPGISTATMVIASRRGRWRRSSKRRLGRGAAGSMLGPRAVALATELNKELGLSPQKTAKALARFGIRVTAGGVVQAIARQARTLEPTYEALIQGVRSSRAVAPDETGWRINGQKGWLWAFAGENVTVYLIAAGRGYEHAAEILGEDYSGVLERDGWAPYRRFANAKHQTCAAHLLRRTGELIADSVAGQARVPHAARRILKDALALRDEHEQDVIDAEEFGLRVSDLHERTDKLLAMRPRHEPNRRLLAHLATEREHMFTFLTEPGVQATNWRAEQALRPAIVNRKSWGGNRTLKGARTQQITMSVIRTARQQAIDPVELMAGAQHSRAPVVSGLIKLPARASPPAELAA
jgi:hypothetical protein